MKIEKKTLFGIGVSAFLLFLAIRHWGDILGFAGTLIGAAFPLIVGGIIAYPINILMTAYERFWFPRTGKRLLIVLRRPVCLVGAILSMIAIVALVVWLILPEFVDCIMLLVDLVPPAIDKLLAYVESLRILPEDIFNFLDNIDWKSQLGKVLDVLGSGVGSVMDTVVKTVVSVFSGTVTALLAVIFSIYLLAGKERLTRQFNALSARYLSEVWHGRVCYVARVLHESFRSFIVGQCTEALILGILCTIGMSILRLPYATMIGALIAFTALIPVAGAYIGAAVGAFMILTVSPMKALIFLVFLVILQQLEGNIIYPKVVGSSIGLPGIWVLAAVTVGGGIFGVTGMLFGVPLAAALYRILGDDIRRTDIRRTDIRRTDIRGNGITALPANPSPAPAPAPKPKTKKKK